MLFSIVQMINNHHYQCQRTADCRNMYTPHIVGVSNDSGCILVQNGNIVALQILLEVIGDVVVQNTKDGILVIVQGSKNVAAF